MKNNRLTFLLGIFIFSLTQISARCDTCRNRNYKTEQVSVVIKFDFNKDGNVDLLKYNKDDYVLKFYLFREGNHELYYTTEFVNQIVKSSDRFFDPVEYIGFDETGNLNIKIELTGRGSYFESYTFQWVENQFILAEVKTTSIHKDDFDFLEKTCHYQFRESIDIRLINYENNRELWNLIQCSFRFLLVNSIDEIYTYYKAGNKMNSPIENRISHYLNNIQLNIKSLSKYNDIAFYLEKNNSHKAAVILLEKITEKFPNRTVAYINLGDAYWGLEENENAMKAYLKYIELMKKNGWERKIPQRVYDRIQLE